MKNTKRIWFLIFLGAIVIAFLSFTYFSKECISCKQVNETKNQFDNFAAESDKQNKFVSKNTENLSLVGDKPQLKLAKKHYDDEWCLAKIELSESDYHYAQSQIEVWDELQGKSSAKSPYSSHADEMDYPNNSLIASYEALQLEQLESLAYNGDKWAMVAFVQNPFADEKQKDEIAKRLLVQGASYYALEHLVIHSLSAAKTSYRLSSSTQKSIEHIKDALTYVYWGLENYSDGGLNSYLGIISREPFKTDLPVNMLLADSGQEIKSRYEDLTQRIKEERNKHSIEVPSPPKAAQRAFAEKIAINRYLSRDQMSFLSNLHVTNNNFINNIPCVDEYLVNLVDKLK
jgi:phage FluMu protein Com